MALREAAAAAVLARRAGLGCLAALALVRLAAPACADTVEEGLTRLRSEDPFDRHRGEAQILRGGTDALPTLVKELAAPERLYRFRAERLFSELLDALILELNTEHQKLVVDQNELTGLNERQQFAIERKTLKEKLDQWKARDPAIVEKLGDLLVLENLEAREKRAANGEGPPLDETNLRTLATLREQRETWRKAYPGFDDEMRPLLRAGRLEALGAEGGDLSELEGIRKKELEERVADREPKVKRLTQRLEDAGLPALNGLLASGIAVRDDVSAFYAQLVEKPLEKRAAEAFPPEASFEALRYTRGLLWAWIARKENPLAAKAKESLAEHTRLVVRDLGDPQPLIRERAADELYLLQRRGLEALKPGDAAPADPFLYGLLRWRIRPRTYAKTGISFEDYPQLSFREKRERFFDYARAAEGDAIPTLRAVVRDDTLEPSFYLKLAAAKALAVLGDLSGNNYLIAKHPDLTLKRPEVSRELLLIEALEHIRDKNYLRAVEDLQKILDDFPFDFQANYHIAFTYLLLKSFAKSIHHFEIARRINPQDQLTLYNLACAYALAGGKTSEALEALEASVKAGFDDADHIQKDSDLDSLRDEPRYRKLIDGLKAAAKQ